MGDLPFVTAGERNEGISDFVSNALAVFSKNTITIDMFGSAKYRNYNYGADDHISVVHTEKIPTCAAVFVCSAIHKVSYTGKFDYGRNFYPKDADDLKICLPIKNGNVDFAFMESFMADLEAQRIAALEAYLVAAGLKDYHLTAAEEKALQDYQSCNFSPFNVTEIFDVKNTDNILSRDIVENSGSVPYLCASAENNSVSSYISYDSKFLDKGNCIFIGGKTFVVSYQEKDFYSNDSHNLTLHLKEVSYADKLTQFYLATCIKKSLGHQYSWGDSISNKKIQKDKVLLPTKDQKPDYDQMAVLISAIQKLVIKDVVCYVDQKIAASNGA